MLLWCLVLNLLARLLALIFPPPVVTCWVGRLYVGPGLSLEWMDGAGERIPYVARRTEWIGLHNCWDLSECLAFGRKSTRLPVSRMLHYTSQLFSIICRTSAYDVIGGPIFSNVCLPISTAFCCTRAVPLHRPRSHPPFHIHVRKPISPSACLARKTYQIFKCASFKGVENLLGTSKTASL